MVRRGGDGLPYNPYNVAQHINGNSDLVNMRRILRIPQVCTPYPANGTDGHGVCEMRHKQRRQNQKSNPTLGVTMMLLVSQSVGL